MYVCAQSCLTHCDCGYYSPPGSSVPGISQARILEQLTCSPLGDLPDARIKPLSPLSTALKVNSLPTELSRPSVFPPFCVSFICLSCIPSLSLSSIICQLFYHPSIIYLPIIYLSFIYLLSVYHLRLSVCLSTFQCVCLSIHIYLLSKVDFFIMCHIFLSMYLLCICLSMKLKFETVSRLLVSDSL